MNDERYNDYPIEQIADSMQKAINRGALTYFKWTCLGCGDRVTANEPDQITILCHHEECGVVTDVRKTGGNFMFILRAGR